MKVCGFTFIRNAVRFDYPVVESIQSILPLCEKMIVVCGNSDDNTRDLISRIDPDKIEITDSVWDDSLRTGGRVLAEETNKAIDRLPGDFDWAFYIQADEVLHEKYHEPVRAAMERWKDDERVEGLLFDYLHFYGSYGYIGNSTNWYRKEIRIIRCDPSIRSYRDAQGFRKEDRRLRVKESHGAIYHYGWVKPPAQQQQKQRFFHSLWHSGKKLEEMVTKSDEFDYSAVDSLARFKGDHPAVMKDRIARYDWQFEYDPSKSRISMKSKLKLFVEKITGWRPGEYKNYKLLK